ncbi:hypothetical protein D3C81_2036740 [compost metagenome]
MLPRHLLKAGEVPAGHARPDEHAATRLTKYLPTRLLQLAQQLGHVLAKAYAQALHALAVAAIGEHLAHHLLGKA